MTMRVSAVTGLRHQYVTSWRFVTGLMLFWYVIAVITPPKMVNHHLKIQ